MLRKTDGRRTWVLLPENNWRRTLREEEARLSKSDLVSECRLCGASDGKIVAEFSGGHYVACGCGVTYPVPFPTDAELRQVYGHGYMDLEIPGHGLHLRFKDDYRETYRKERDMTLADLGVDGAWFRNKRTLDIGCANGIFLDYLRTHGADATGIDISAEMVAAARSRGLDAREVSLAAVGGTWDVCCLWDVIEHLPDPLTTLAEIARLVPTGGSLFIQTPCTGLISEAFGSAWRNFTYPQHVHLFSKVGLYRRLADAGFAVQSAVTFGSGNTAGTIPPASKRAADRVAKAADMGDTIALRAVRTAT